MSIDVTEQSALPHSVRGLLSHSSPRQMTLVNLRAVIKRYSFFPDEGFFLCSFVVTSFHFTSFPFAFRIGLDAGKR